MIDLEDIFCSLFEKFNQKLVTTTLIFYYLFVKKKYFSKITQVVPSYIIADFQHLKINKFLTKYFDFLLSKLI